MNISQITIVSVLKTSVKYFILYLYLKLYSGGTVKPHSQVFVLLVMLFWPFLTLT